MKFIVADTNKRYRLDRERVLYCRMKFRTGHKELMYDAVWYADIN